MHSESITIQSFATTATHKIYHILIKQYYYDLPYKYIMRCMAILKALVKDLLLHDHHMLTEKLVSSDRTKCQHFGGMYNISPGSSSHSR